MKFDVQTHLNAINRSVSFLDRDGQPAVAVGLSRVFDVTLLDMWDAVTSANRIPLWFLPITGELRHGGRYQLEGNAGGTIETCDYLNHIGLTWEFGDDTSWVDIRFTHARGNRARLTLTHTSILSDFWDTYGPGATGVGWEMGFLGLALYTSDPNFEKPDPEEFAYSPDGKAMLTNSSEAWVRAAIAAGTDSDKAHAAGAQTTAFYKGETV